MVTLNEENKNYHSLVDQAEGAFLKREYLEAFLIQSCVIEGIVKNYSLAKLDVQISASQNLEKKLKNSDLAKLMDILFFAGKISVEPDVLCINSINSKISITLEGKGNHAFISQ